MRGLWTSIRYTIRLLRKAPTFTIIAVLVLGVGIGANTAIFSLIDAVVLNPLPFPHPDRLVSVANTSKEISDLGVDLPDYVDFRPAQQSFEELAVARQALLDLSDSGGAQQLNAGFVSASLFTVTGQPFVIGRPFTDQEDSFGGPLLVVLTEHYWRTHFQSDPKVLGKNLTLSGRSYEIVGVCPTQVDDWGIDSPELYVPIKSVAGADDPVKARDAHYLSCFGRLKPGITMNEAETDLARIARILQQRYPDINQGYGVRLMPLLDNMVGDAASSLWLLGAAVACLLLIAVANVANLLYCRAVEQQKETVIRRTLGATRSNLAGKALLESLIFSLLGSGIGLLVALGLIGSIKEVGLQESLARVDRVAFDGTTLTFFAAVTGLVSLLTGSLPALKAAAAGTGLTDLPNRSGTAGRERQRTQRILVIGQVALSCILLTAAALLVRSFLAAQSQPLGFNPEHLVAADVSLTSRKYDDLAKIREFFDRVLERIRQLPGITDVGMADDLPFVLLWENWDPFFLPGESRAEPGRVPSVTTKSISPDYFRTLQIRILRGRGFSAEDTATSQPVVIINEALASHYFPNEDPIGKQIIIYAMHADNNVPRTIVGVAGDVLYDSPDGHRNAFDGYFPYSQRPMNNEVLVLRTAGDVARLAPALRKIVAAVDPEVPIAKIMNFNRFIEARFTSRKTGMLFVSVFSAAALFLSAIGIYGTLAYTVTQRTRELGIRVSLGSTSLGILRLVLGDGRMVVGIGLLTGVLVALGVAGLLQSVLYGVSAHDPIATGMGIIVLTVVGFTACLLPAIRAARIDPTAALRSE
ncbi:MAG TPA: ABC transporter permease [Chthoniobacterales bacterium]|nr:ABC transporter permease [Chthoniobacterales bacterium]